MTPYETWKKSKGRVDLRKYTRTFESHFKGKDRIQVLPSKIYAMKYRGDSLFETDKHHVTPVILSFGRFKDDEGFTYTRGINLLYLRNEQMIEIMEEVHKLHKFPIGQRVKPLIEIHDKWMTIAPFVFKNFEERRIVNIAAVNEEEWGMIPLLHKSLWGNFNPTALNESFQIENKKKPIRETKKKVEMEKPKEDLDTMEESFTEGTIDSSFFNDDI